MSKPLRQNNWVADLAFEVALGYYTPEELDLKYSLTPERRELVQASPEFQRAVALYRREIDETGEEFKLKARKLASELLPELALIVADDKLSTSDRINAYKELARLSGYGRDDAAAGQTQAAFQLQINFSGAAPSPPTVTIEGEAP